MHGKHALDESGKHALDESGNDQLLIIESSSCETDNYA